MEAVNLQLGSKSFKLKFGLKLFRILGTKWNVPGINEVVAKLSVLDGSQNELTFEQLDILEDLVRAAIVSGGHDYSELADIEVIDEFLKNPQALHVLTEQIVASLPQAQPVQDETLGKPKAVRQPKK